MAQLPPSASMIEVHWLGTGRNSCSRSMQVVSEHDEVSIIERLCVTLTMSKSNSIGPLTVFMQNAMQETQNDYHRIAA